MKTCPKCKITKESNAFGKSKTRKDGLAYRCKDCKREENKLWRESNIDRNRENAKRWHKENSDKQKKNSYFKQNPEGSRAAAKRWRDDNKDKVNAIGSKRRAAKLQRTVSWANPEVIKSYYAEAKRLTELTGISFHVDHIIPLQGTTVSGLHVENNLQVLPYYENCKKGNRY